MTKTLGLSPVARSAGLAPPFVRAILGVIMAAHGWQMLTQMGPAGFGHLFRADGHFLAGVMGSVVTFVELARGILPIVGLLSRLAALLLTITPAVALLLVKVNVGPIAPQGTGVELNLALIAGLLVILLAGPGKLPLDHALGLERDAVEEQTA